MRNTYCNRYTVTETKKSKDGYSMVSIELNIIYPSGNCISEIEFQLFHAEAGLDEKNKSPFTGKYKDGYVLVDAPEFISIHVGDLDQLVVSADYAKEVLRMIRSRENYDIHCRLCRFLESLSRISLISQGVADL